MAGIYKVAVPLRKPGDPVPLTVVEPYGYARGGIVVLHEFHRHTPALLGLLRSLAEEGWVAVVPNLFHRVVGEPRGSVFGTDLFDAFDASFDWLIGHGVNDDCIGVLGFDEAGTAAFLVATNRPVGAAVSIGPRGLLVPLAAQAQALVDAAPQLQAPWLGLFGADDPDTPVDHVDKLTDAVASAPVAANIVTYEGLRHRADEGGPMDDELIDALTRVFDWFDSFLR